MWLMLLLLAALAFVGCTLALLRAQNRALAESRAERTKVYSQLEKYSRELSEAAKKAREIQHFLKSGG